MKIIVDEMPRKPEDCNFFKEDYTIDKRCALRIGMSTDFGCRLERGEECPFLKAGVKND